MRASPTVTSDVRLAQGGRVIHAVAGHGHHLAAGLPLPDDAQLFLGADAGVDALLGRLVRMHDSQLPRDGERGGGMVTGDLPAQGVRWRAPPRSAPPTGSASGPDLAAPVSAGE